VSLPIRDCLPSPLFAAIAARFRSFGRACHRRLQWKPKSARSRCKSSLAAILTVTTHLAIEDLEIVFNGMRGRVTARYSLALCVIVFGRCKLFAEARHEIGIYGGRAENGCRRTTEQGPARFGEAVISRASQMPAAETNISMNSPTSRISRERVRLFEQARLQAKSEIALNNRVGFSRPVAFRLHHLSPSIR
jgi:hypothetical protein